MPTEEFSARFGPNDWLAEEMFQQYQKDPNSVPASWQEIFTSLNPSNGKHVAATEVPAPEPTPVITEQVEMTPVADAPTTVAAVPAPEPATLITTNPTPIPAIATPAAPTETIPTAAETASATQVPVTPAAASETAAAPAANAAVTNDAASNGASEAPTHTVLRGAPARTAQNMATSLTVPTATSVRSVPVKLLWDNRTVINNHLNRTRGGKVSFTHIIGYAIVQALKTMPEMNVGFAEIDGKPNLITPNQIGLGLAIDLPKPDGTRQLLVPAIKGAEKMSFAEFWTEYERIVTKARDGKLAVADFQGTTISLTNPGTIGTNHSVPRLMTGQGAIIGVGSMDYPPEYQGASEDTINRNAISKIMTLTSTYDHRVIQGAQSGEFLKRIHALLLGEENFFDDIFASLQIPYDPIRWSADISTSHDDEISKQARILELIHAYRARGHLIADTNPLDYERRSHPDLAVEAHGLTLWDLDREFPTGSFGGDRRFMKMRDILGILRDSYCRSVGIEYMHIAEPDERKWLQDRVEQPHQNHPGKNSSGFC